jgi:hypothetical protein
VNEKYQTILILFLSITIFLTFISFLLFSKYIEKNDSTTSKALSNVIFESLKYLGGASMIVICFFILISLILKLFQQSNTVSESLIGRIITYLIVLILIGVIIKYVVLRYLESLTSTNVIIKYINYIVKFLFFIPCLLIYIGEFLLGEYKITKPIDIYFFIITILIYLIILIFWYFLYPYLSKKYYTDGAILLLNKPISLDKETVIATYSDLYDDTLINKNTNKQNNYYHYAFSFWFYIDAYPPNTNEAYQKDTPIINYGYNPIVTYNASKNTLKVALIDNELLKKCKETTTETCIQKLSNDIYVNKNLKLQKWNNMVLIFNSGTLDIFYNNTLVKSGIGAPNISSLNSLISGSKKGLKGSICNVLFLKKKNTNLESINNLFNSVKDKNPPIG